MVLFKYINNPEVFQLNRIVFSLLALFVLFPMAYAHGADTKCGTLTKDEAQSIMQTLNPGLSVIDVGPSALPEMWEVTVATSGQKVLAYIDCSKRYILLGELLDTKERKNLTRERMAEINKVDVSSIPVADALVMGDKNAPHKVIVFDDPECPYCAKLQQEIKRVIEKRKDIVFLIKMFPLPMHAGAYAKAKAIVCEKSLKLLEDAFDGKEIPPAKCDTKVVDDNIALAGKLGIEGTPGIIFPDGRVVSGYMTADTLIKALDENK